MAGAGAMGIIRIAFVAFSLISALFFNKKQNPTSLQNLSFQTTQRGTPLPILYGTRRIAGNVIWAGPLKVNSNQSGKGSGKGSPGGKGGNQATTYQSSFAIGICEGPCDAILNVWADKIKLDLSQHPEITFYLGTGANTPDPTITAAKTSGAQYAEYSKIDGFAPTVFTTLTPVTTGSDSIVGSNDGGKTFGVGFTRVGSSPGQNQYTINYGTGQISFGGNYTNLDNTGTDIGIEITVTYQTAGQSAVVNRNESFLINGASPQETLTYTPIYTDSESVYFLTPQPDGSSTYTVMTRVASGPTTNQYTIDYNTGKIVFGGSYTNITVYVSYVQNSSGSSSVAANNVPGYPWTCYAVFDLEDLGTSARIPNYTFEVVRIGTAASRNALVYFVNSGGGGVAIRGSTDDGATWNSITGPGSSQQFFFMTAPTTVWCVSAPVSNVITVFKSTDFGTTWTTIGSFNMSGYTVQSSLLVTKNGTVLVLANRTSDGICGVFRSTDGGVTYTFVATDPISAGTLYPLLQENPANPGSIFLLTRSADGITYPSKLFRSTDEGATWSKVTDTNSLSGVPGSSNWIMRSLFCSSNGTIMLSVDQALSPFNTALFKSSDNGSTWSAQVFNVTTGNSESPGYEAETQFSEVLGGSHKGRFVFRAKYFSDDSGSTWGTLASTPDQILTDASGQTQNAILSSLALDGLWRSINGGDSWTKVIDLSGVAEFAIQIDGAPLVPGSATDANPADIIQDLLENSRYGAGIDPSLIDPLTFSSAHAYYLTNGILLSPYFKDRKTALQHIEEICVIADAFLVWSQGLIKLIPRGISQTAYPITTASYVRMGSTQIGKATASGGPTVSSTAASRRGAIGTMRHQVTRQGVNEIVNRVIVAYTRRNDEYNPDSEEWKDDWMIQNDEGQEVDLAADAICTAQLARQVGQRFLWTRSFNRLNAKVPIGPQDQVVEPGDIVSWTDPTFGFTGKLMRVMAVSEDKDARLLLDLIEENPTILGWPLVSPGDSSVGGVSAIQPPGIFTHTQLVVTETTQPDVNGNPSFLVAMGGVDTTWAGARLYVSNDGTTYARIMEVHASACMAACQIALPDAPTVENSDEPYVFDATSVLRVKVITPNKTLASVTDAQWRSGVNRILIDNEIIYFQNATLAATGTYVLSNFIRGMEGTAHAAHTTSSTAVFLDQNVQVLTPVPGGLPIVGMQQMETVSIPWAYVGQTLYFKATTLNVNGAEQDISQVEPVTITYQALGGLPMAPSDLAANGLTENDADVTVAATPNRNLILAWLYQSPTIQPDSELVGTTTPGHDVKFSHYRLQVWVSGVQVHQEDSLATEAFTYTEAQNIADNGSWQSVVTIKLYTVNVDGGVSAVTQKTFTMH